MNGATENPKAIRAFLALPVPGEVIEKLQEFQNRLREVLSGVSWSRPEQQHLTVRFYGNVPVERLSELKEAIRQVCESARPFRVCAEELGSFAERIIWVGISGGLKSLQELEARLSRATRGFGDREEQRIFQPHLTIGRVKGRRGGRRQITAAIRERRTTRLGEWTADHLELMRSDLSSHGASHTCLARFALAGKMPAQD